MPLPHRIGLGGRMGSGKTSAARLINAQHGHLVLSFAFELRRMLAPAYGAIDKASMYEINGQTITGRELLQHAGKALRALDSEILLRAMTNAIGTYPETMPIVVDDVRMEAEAQHLRSLGFEIYILESDSATRQSRVGAGWAGHDDETEVIAFEAPRIITSGILPEEVIRIIAEERRP